ncbi:alpha/beta fold hydrolase [Arthrobacter castelli]|uniref:alpha/beta fold hydrolase n=1 Tax=Arthrobacter castelli TaxID=271431 RepID=UPI00047BB90F|nr:alpha/beta hydrolase [Arthrobacter castelli]
MAAERVVFVHGSGKFGAAAWPVQHRLAGRYDCLFVKRHGFDAAAAPEPTDFDADTRIVLQNLNGRPGHVVAASQGAISAMMAAVARPDLVKSLSLFEPACLSLTADLPATMQHRALVGPLFERRQSMSDTEFLHEFVRLVFSAEAQAPQTEDAQRSAARLRMQRPPWEAPLDIVPGVPTLVVTGAWEPLYEEVAGYLEGTGARHLHAGGDHRPQDTGTGHQALEEFLAGHN